MAKIVRFSHPIAPGTLVGSVDGGRGIWLFS